MDLDEPEPAEAETGQDVEMASIAVDENVEMERAETMKQLGARIRLMCTTRSTTAIGAAERATPRAETGDEQSDRTR
ncbi:hypothetical protein FRC07_009025 [Ceratobasidium sp. 392]|nr:hypothetical protein FRC07_009025 [Ceratobasidium sp. 392]